MSFADEDDTPPASPLGHADNAALCGAIGNYYTELQEHTRRIGDLYEALKVMTVPAPITWKAPLVQEFERHHKEEGERLEGLRAVAEKR